MCGLQGAIYNVRKHINRTQTLKHNWRRKVDIFAGWCFCTPPHPPQGCGIQNRLRPPLQLAALSTHTLPYHNRSFQPSGDCDVEQRIALLSLQRWSLLDRVSLHLWPTPASLLLTPRISVREGEEMHYRENCHCWAEWSVNRLDLIERKKNLMPEAFSANLAFDICHLNLSTFRERRHPFCGSKMPYTANHLVGQGMSIHHPPPL